MSPEKSIAYWTDYIHRHNGAEHLKSNALNLSWYQYFLLDVIFVMLILICIILFISYTILKLIYQYSLRCLRHFKEKSE
jgi:glucuronosyltransferase